MSLMALGLQRAKTAREAIKVMTDLVARYGYSSEGESFSIADPNEVWIMEMIGKGDEKEKVPCGWQYASPTTASVRMPTKAASTSLT